MFYIVFYCGIATSTAFSLFIKERFHDPDLKGKGEEPPLLVHGVSLVVQVLKGPRS